MLTANESVKHPDGLQTQVNNDFYGQKESRISLRFEKINNIFVSVKSEKYNKNPKTKTALGKSADGKQECLGKIQFNEVKKTND